MFRILMSLAHLVIRAKSMQDTQYRQGAKEREIAAKEESAKNAYNEYCEELRQLRETMKNK